MAIDIIFVAVLIFGFWQGYSKGIISTVFGILIYVFGFVLAYKMAPVAGNILQKILNNDNPLMIVAAFALNLVVIIFVMRQAAKGFEGLMEAAYLGTVNNVLGGAVVGGFYVLVFSVLLWFVNQGNLVNETVLEQSKTYPLLAKMPGQAKSVVVRLKPSLLDAWGTSNKWMDDFKNFGIQRTEHKQKIYEVPDNGKAIEDDPTIRPEPAPRRRPQDLDEGSGIED
jgi:membrane protein required for colicin V production